MQFSKVCRSFETPAGRVDVLKDIDLTIDEGEFLVITGPSGSGKSTLLHICALIDQPSSGGVKLGLEEISSLSETELSTIRKQKIGIVFQRFCLLPHRSALDNVLFRFRYIEPPPPDAESKAHDIIKQLGLASVANRQARLLSSGEQQRVAIARAVVQKPVILLADEPTGNLDSKSAQVVMDSFKTLNKTGLTVVMVTHNEALLSHATRHLICADGAVQEGPLP